MIKRPSIHLNPHFYVGIIKKSISPFRKTVLEDMTNRDGGRVTYVDTLSAP